jgi:hypothetical protein
MNKTLRISASHVSGNLTVFLLHGPNSTPKNSYTVLHQAMDRKEAIVHETGNVGELLIENRGELDLFVQAGDIVKGGRQDRLIGVDLIVERGSGPIPLPSFCVESGRWSKRGNESEQHFSGSPKSVASKEVKLSARVASSQSEVWQSIAEEQVKLGKAVHDSVSDETSNSSYQLMLENKKLQKQTSAGLAKMLPLINQSADAIGWAFAINGKVNSADIYGSHDLFALLWEKLISAAVTEALAESSVGPKGKTEARDIATFLEKKEMKLAKSDQITSRVEVRQFHGKECARFETLDRKYQSVCVHMNALSTRR